jgi:hypothetical protein
MLASCLHHAWLDDRCFTSTILLQTDLPTYIVVLYPINNELHFNTSALRSYHNPTTDDRLLCALAIVGVQALDDHQLREVVDGVSAQGYLLEQEWHVGATSIHEHAHTHLNTCTHTRTLTCDGLRQSHFAS